MPQKAQVLESMRKRDEIDRNRAVAPLRPAEDAVIVNSDGRGIDEIFGIMKGIVDKA